MRRGTIPPMTQALPHLLPPSPRNPFGWIPDAYPRIFIDLQTDLTGRKAGLNWAHQFFGLDALKTAAILSPGNLVKGPAVGTTLIGRRLFQN